MLVEGVFGGDGECSGVGFACTVQANDGRDKARIAYLDLSWSTRNENLFLNPVGSMGIIEQA